MDANLAEKRPRRRGILRAVTSIMGRLIDRPRVKDAARRLAIDLDPAEARELVRTAMWRDPDLLFTAVGAAPKVVNACIQAADELLIQVEDKLTVAMRGELAQAVLDDVDWEGLSRVVERSRSLGREMRPLFERARARAQSDNQKGETS